MLRIGPLDFFQGDCRILHVTIYPLCILFCIPAYRITEFLYNRSLEFLPKTTYSCIKDRMCHCFTTYFTDFFEATYMYDERTYFVTFAIT